MIKDVGKGGREWGLLLIAQIFADLTLHDIISTFRTSLSAKVYI